MSYPSHVSLEHADLFGSACCYWKGSADTARSRASDPADIVIPVEWYSLVYEVPVG